MSEQKDNKSNPHIELPIQTPRLYIDEFSVKDIEALRGIAFRINEKSDKEKDKGYFPFYAFQVEKNTENRDKKVKQKVNDFVARCHKERMVEPRDVYRLAIRLNNKEKTLIGNVTVNMLPINENGKVIYGDLGYFLDPNYENQGYAKEAARLISNKFFKYYKYMDVTVHPENNPSNKLLLSLGGEEIGSCEHSQYGNGEPRRKYGITKENIGRTSPFAQLWKNIYPTIKQNAINKEGR